MRSITLYSKPDCHLCHEVRDLLASLRADFPHILSEVDISSSADLWNRYRYAIPVLVIDGTLELGAPIGERELRAALGRKANG